MTTKTVFQFDIAGLLVGETQADESPLEPGVFLIPARCTETPPPAEWPGDKWPRWNTVVWELVTKPEPQPSGEVEPDPVAKLQAFLAANPDVAALLNQGQPSNV